MPGGDTTDAHSATTVSACFKAIRSNRQQVAVPVQVHRQRERVIVTGSELSAAVNPPTAGVRGPATVHQLTAAVRTVSVQAAVELLDRAQSRGTPVHSTASSSAPSRSSRHQTRSQIDVREERGGDEPWPLSAAVAAWLDGASQAEARVQSAGGQSGRSRIKMPSRSDRSGSAAGESNRGPHAVSEHTVIAAPASEESRAQQADASEQAGSLHSAAGTHIELDTSRAALSQDDMVASSPSRNAPNGPADAEAPTSALRSGPWLVSAGVTAEAGHPDTAQTMHGADLQSSACEGPAANPDASAAASPSAEKPDDALAVAPPACQPLQEQSAQTTLHIAPDVAVELRAAEGSQSAHVAVGQGPLAPADSATPAEGMQAAASATHGNNRQELPRKLPERKGSSVASSEARCGTLHALKLRLSARSSSHPGRPQSAPIRAREPPLLQPRWSIVRPDPPPRDHNQACSVD